VPDAYAAIDWARADNEFLEDWARLSRALSRFAWRTTTRGRDSARVRAAVAAAPTVDPITGQALAAGATAVMRPDQTLEAIPKTGATIDSESGRPMAAMVAAGLDVSVVALLGDPGTTGARATAETLDKPTHLMASTRRGLWTGALQRIFTYVIDQAVIAPQGPLRGTVSRDPVTGAVTVVLAGDTEGTVDVSWPSLDEDAAVDVLVRAIAMADQTDKVPPLVIARLLLEALGVADVDEVLEDLVDEDGNFLPPETTAGQVAVDAFRRGEDPAAALNGNDDEDPVGDDQAA
jgi:hypothetical protein